MFAAVILEQPRGSGCWGALLDKLRPPRPQVEERQAGESRFWQITCPISRDGRHWTAIAQAAGRFSTRLVVDPAVELPPGLRRFDPEPFYSRLLLNTARAALVSSGLAPERRTVGLWDEAGEALPLAEPLLDLCPALKVVTSRPEPWRALSDRMLEERGAPIVLCRDEESLADCVLILAPRGMERPPAGCPVFSLVDSGPQTVNHFSCGLPSACAGALPTGMEPVYFLAALYQLGGMTQLGELAASRCRVGGRDAPAGELAALLRRREEKLR